MPNKILKQINENVFFFFLRQRMKEESLIHKTYSACFNDENNNNHSYSLFHNCFHASEILNWLVNKQLCKTIVDGKEIFQVLTKLKIIHHGKKMLFFGTVPNSNMK